MAKTPSKKSTKASPSRRSLRRERDEGRCGLPRRCRCRPRLARALTGPSPPARPPAPPRPGPPVRLLRPPRRAPQSTKKQGEKSHRKRRVETFGSYIYKVLKQVHNDVGVSKKAMCVARARARARPAASACARPRGRAERGRGPGR